MEEKFFNLKKEISIKAKEAWKTENSNRKTNKHKTKIMSTTHSKQNTNCSEQRKKYFQLQG